MIFLSPSSRQIHTNTNTNTNINTNTNTISSNSKGPHNLDVISVLECCLLGDAYALKVKVKNKKDIPGTKFRFKQSGRHKAYLFFLYEFFYNRGYCTNSWPK